AGLGRDAVAHLQAQWEDLTPLIEAHAGYQREHGDDADVDAHNLAQRALHANFTPFFAAIHASLKQLDKAIRQLEKRALVLAKAAGKRGSADRRTKVLKDAVQALHDEVKSAESWFQHVQWLQDRFPQAKYEDVIGLCKLASPTELMEQDYSLNPGRYVGVVIEEDGKTEEDFIEDLCAARADLATLSEAAHDLEAVIFANLKEIVGEA
ncbi:MAG: N-6 DNA methylase, partial [Ramlibacter sp.]|nr:N-6 DNA methylase [Ramlibacter sp.]